ncbi:MAG: T9SS type A sorting domain-containing protein [Bacteroidetes bacterium]|nr:T9SS type A sorting domain-containing protein [Bacteroidota bacterium]
MKKQLLSFLSVLALSIGTISAQCTITFSNVVNNSCNSSNQLYCNGSASAMVSPANVYTYSWSNGQFLQGASLLCAGTYTVQATGLSISGSTTCTGTVTITQPTAITAVSTATATTCLSCTDGKLSATASGGTGPYSYTWQPAGLVGQTQSNVPAGSYFVQVTDANGCTFLDTNPTIVLPGGFSSVNETNSALVSVYPNPAENELFIKSTSNLFFDKNTVKIYDVLGKQIKMQSITLSTQNSASFDIATLPKGLYYFIIENNQSGQQVTSRFIKK